MNRRIHGWLSRVRGASRPNDVDARFDDEAQFHLDMLTEKLIREGKSADDARNEALRTFGGRSRYAEEARDEYRSRALDELSRDLLAGMRTIRRHKAFAFASIATMAVGIAATASIFSIADAFLFRPLPFRDADRIVVLGDAQGSEERFPASYMEFSDWRSMLRETSSVVAAVHGGMTWVNAEAAERVRVGRVSDGYFELFGIRPLVGRTLQKGDHAEGAERVAVVSRAFWTERFGASPRALGERVQLNNQSYAIVGVVESGLETGADRTQMWIALEAYPPWRDRGTHYLFVFGRMRDGATLASLRNELAVVGKQIREANNTTHAIHADGLRDRIVGAGRMPMLMLLGAVGLLLAIAIANVAGLLQARTASRATELAVRTALGASRWRLVRQIVTESLVLAVAGGTLGVVLSVWTIKGLVLLWPPTAPRPVDFQVDLRVVAVALALSLIGAFVAAMLTGLVRRPAGSLSDRATGGVGTSRAMRRVLVASEVAITMVLLVGAGLTMTSLRRVLQSDIGFSPERLLTARLPLQGDVARQRAFYGDLLARVRALPGVEEVGAVMNLPLSGGGMAGDFTIEGRPEVARDSAPVSEKSIVTPGYFRTMGIRLLAGRDFDERDVDGKVEVAIISESMAKRHWPNASPIGSRIQMMGDSTHWQEIVGVVADTKLYALEEAPSMAAYVPFHQWPSGGMGIVIRTPNGDAVQASLRSIVRSLDPQLPVTALQSYDRLIYRATHGRRVPAVLLVAFATLALLLAAVGLYGLLAYSVQQRRHEMGVRMAVGAQRASVVRLVIAEGVRLVLFGAAVGVAGAALAARAIRSLLYGIEPGDPGVYVAAAAALVAVAVAASAVPAMRASRVDPASVLRSD
jgi:putative ABC transport system permease protein